MKKAPQASSSDPEPEPPPDPATSDLLEAARTRLLHRDIAGARSTIHRALSIAQSPSGFGQAELLLAETYVRSGEIDTAMTQLLAIATRYPDLASVGGRALFQAARLEQLAGHVKKSRELFETYLTRHPSGVLVPHVRALLDRLQSL